MHKLDAIVLAVIMVVFLTAGFARAQQDAKGCKDHPLFTRLSNCSIVDCKEQAFATIGMYDPLSRKRTSVEGRTVSVRYAVQKEFAGTYTKEQIARNFSNAITAIGGNAYEYNIHLTYMNLIKDGKETWIRLEARGPTSSKATGYELTIVERGALKQEVTADAEWMAEGIGAAGHAAVYGIYFDYNKADLKPESEPTLGEIAQLLAENPSLKVFIIGHTDNVGALDFNMKLSRARAEAVKQALIIKHKVTPQNVEAYGVGQLAPVASNKTDEGRAKNRRVELVEQ